MGMSIADIGAYEKEINEIADFVAKQYARFRILKITKENGRTYYVVQQRMRFFWIGPHIWEYYILRPVYCYDEPGWTYWLWNAHEFVNANDAQNIVDEYVKQIEGKVKHKQIVYEA